LRRLVDGTFDLDRFNLRCWVDWIDGCLDRLSLWTVHVQANITLDVCICQKFGLALPPSLAGTIPLVSPVRDELRRLVEAPG
jgi:hypothetical protein